MSRRILLADDSVTIQKVIELTFMDEDYEVTAVGNGDDAVAELTRSAPDLVLADVHMPGANGYEVCRRAKELHPELPVLLLVGTFEPFDEARSREVGAASFLKKPFDSQELLQIVARLLGQGGPAAAAEPPAAAAAAPSVDEPAVWADETQQPGALTDYGREAAFAPVEEAVAPFYGEPVAAAEEDEPFRWDVEPEELAPEPFAEPEPVEEETPAAASRSIGFSGFSAFATPAATPAEPPEPEPEPEPPAVATPAATAAAPSAAATAPSAVELSGAALSDSPLSDSDIERIARRVAELVGDRVVRDVAWEVVPDMAEVVIKERIRELESQVE